LEELGWYHVILMLSASTFLFECYLDYRQIRCLKEASPQQLSGLVDLENFRKFSDWITHRLKLGIFENTVGFILEWAVLYSGLLVVLYGLSQHPILAPIGILSQRFTDWGLPSFLIAIVDEKILRGVLFIFFVSGFSTAVKLPFELYRIQYVDDVTDSKSWALDQFKAFIASLVMGIPVIGITLSMLHWNFPFHWLITSFFVSVVALGFSDLYADVLVPLFDTITLLDNKDKHESELNDKIKDLSKKFGDPVGEVYKIQSAGSNTSHSNAFIMGFGWAKKRIVLYDNLIVNMSTEEVLAIVGHEIGHYKFHHLWKKLIFQLIFVGNFIYMFSLLINNTNFYLAFGFEYPDASVGLILYSYLYNSVAACNRVLTNYVSRKFEYKADEFAIVSGLKMEMALRKLYILHNNALDIISDKLYSMYHYSHPSLQERLQRMEDCRKKMQ